MKAFQAPKPNNIEKAHRALGGLQDYTKRSEIPFEAQWTGVIDMANVAVDKASNYVYTTTSSSLPQSVSYTASNIATT